MWQRQIMADPNLTSGTKLVGVAISWHLNRNSRVAWPGINKLARVTNTSRDTVKRAIKQLEKAGHLRVERARTGTRNVPNRYSPVLKMHPPRCADAPRVGAPMHPEPLNEPLSEPLLYRHDLHRVSSKDQK